MDICIVRGDTLALSISKIQMTDGSEYILKDTDVIYLDIKKTSADKVAVIRKSVKSSDYVNGKLPIVILPIDTVNLSCGDYVYDVRLFMDADNVYTIIPMSKFKIFRNVTDIPSTEGEG